MSFLKWICLNYFLQTMRLNSLLCHIVSDIFMGKVFIGSWKYLTMFELHSLENLFEFSGILFSGMHFCNGLFYCLHGTVRNYFITFQWFDQAARKILKKRHHFHLLHLWSKKNLIFYKKNCNNTVQCRNLA